jgi:hypothetical protein
MVQINDAYYEDLDAASFKTLLTRLKAGQKVKPGSLKGRTASKACLASCVQPRVDKEG